MYREMKTHGRTGMFPVFKILFCFLFIFVAERKCEDGMMKCGNKVECIYAGFFCDGETRCSDRSDEDKELCTAGN